MSKTALAMGAAALLTGLLYARVAAAGPAAHRATGGGTVDWPLARVTYGFTAEVDAAGVAKGEAEFQFRDAGIRAHVDIDCLTVVGNDAWLGGVIKSSDNPGLVGQQIVWRVQDNGQGHGASPDMTSPVVLGVPPGFCGTTPAIGLIPWTNGNVQIK